MIQRYIEPLTRVPAICDEFRETIRRNFFGAGSGWAMAFSPNEWYCFTPLYRDYYDGLRRIIEICDVFGVAVLEKRKAKLTQAVADLANPETVRNLANFESRLNLIKSIFADAEAELRTIPSLLSKEETERLDEAIHDLLEGCYYSATAMSVAAIEFRLLRLMKNASRDEGLDDLTLGQLINKALSDKTYSGLVPKKHEPLLQLCNTYRIFSVHAKAERITKSVSYSMLNLSLSFLLDEAMRESNEVFGTESWAPSQVWFQLPLAR